MNKRILFVIPDYSKTTLRLIKPFFKKGFEVHLVVPFRFRWHINVLIFLFPYILFFKKLKRRKDDFKGFVTSPLKLISISTFKLISIIISHKIQHRYLLSNSFKTVIEAYIIKKVDFSLYDYVYTFDSCAIIYLDAARKAGVRTIMEFRASLIDHTLYINEKLNEAFHLNLDTRSNYLHNPSLVQWYGKLRNEPNYADKIVVYSNYQLNQFKETNYDNKNIIKIPLSTPFAKKNTIKNADPPPIKFIYYGNIYYGKGIKHLLIAWTNFMQGAKRDATLILIGSCFPEFKEELTNLPVNVTYKGYFFHDKLVKELDAAHVFIMPSCSDSYGLVVPEALSFNMPVICSPNVGASELITNMETGIIYDDAFSVAKLQAAIEYFVKNPNEINRMSKNIYNDKIRITREKEILLAEQEIDKLLS